METGHGFHKDSFGLLQTELTGGGQWTPRLLRSTKIAVPHIAKADVFTYKCQLNHDKKLLTNLDGFHIHFLPIGAVTGGEIIALDFAWGWITGGNSFPDTLPNTGTKTITLVAGDQFKYKIENIVTNLAYPTSESYSSEFFIQCTRRNDAQDTYAGEFALLDGDAHYIINHLGSYNEYTD
jgi:hypothetical protein